VVGAGARAGRSQRRNDQECSSALCTHEGAPQRGWTMQLAIAPSEFANRVIMLRHALTGRLRRGLTGGCRSGLESRAQNHCQPAHARECQTSGNVEVLTSMPTATQCCSQVRCVSEHCAVAQTTRPGGWRFPRSHAGRSSTSGSQSCVRRFLECACWQLRNYERKVCPRLLIKND